MANGSQFRDVLLTSAFGADAVGDDAASRTVYVTVVALAVIGVLFIALAVWLVRSTRPDPELLAPLEMMDERRWRSRNPQDRRRLLDDARPTGAAPITRAPSAPTVDSEFGARRPVRDFDDLAAADPLVVSDGVVVDVADVPSAPARDSTPQSTARPDGPTTDHADPVDGACGNILGDLDDAIDADSIDDDEADDSIRDDAIDADDSDDDVVHADPDQSIDDDNGDVDDGDVDDPALRGEGLLQRDAASTSQN